VNAHIISFTLLLSETTLFKEKEKRNQKRKEKKRNEPECLLQQGSVIVISLPTFRFRQVQLIPVTTQRDQHSHKSSRRLQQMQFSSPGGVQHQRLEGFGPIGLLISS
jgi:hypothetical protein